MMSELYPAERRTAPNNPCVQVTANGRTFSVKTGRELKQQSDRCGYRYCRSVAVHRMVAFAFHGPPGPKQEVRHLNGKPWDNRIENLAWGTRKENMDDQRRHGTLPIGSKRALAKLDEEKVAIIRRSVAEGACASSLARIFGVSPSTIRRAVNSYWSHVIRTDVPSIAAPRLNNKGERHGNSKLTDASVRAIREARLRGEDTTHIAKAFGVGALHVNRLIRGEEWQHVAVADGLQSSLDAIRTPPGRKLSDEDVREIRALRLSGVRRKDLAQRFGVHPVYITRLMSSQRRPSVT